MNASRRRDTLGKALENAVPQQALARPVLPIVGGMVMDALVVHLAIIVVLNGLNRLQLLIQRHTKAGCHQCQQRGSAIARLKQCRPNVHAAPQCAATLAPRRSRQGATFVEVSCPATWRAAAGTPPQGIAAYHLVAGHSSRSGRRSTSERARAHQGAP
eukprot:scaffold146533_cov32-Tisochrysis_lutea.AAC.2